MFFKTIYTIRQVQIRFFDNPSALDIIPHLTSEPATAR